MRNTLVLLLFLISTQCYCLDSTLVETGSIKISSDEFKDRFELLPVLNNIKDKDLEKKKLNFLYSLIAEKLWALEAESLGLDTTIIFKSAYYNLEKMYVRDALYTIEIKNKVKINPHELEEGIRRSLIKLHLNVVESINENQINGIYNLLKSGIAFDSLNKYAKIKINPVTVEYGQLVKPVEDIVYNLNESEFSLPIQVPNGWLIFCLVKKEKIPTAGIDKALEKVKKTLEDKAEDSLYNSFMNDFFDQKRITAAGYLFKSIVDKITEVLMKKEPIELSGTHSFTLDAEGILKIKQALGTDTLKMPFINFEKNPLSTDEFLNYLAVDEFKTDSVNNKIILARLNTEVKHIIEQELLAREGYKRGLQNLPDVKVFLNMWRENILAQSLQAKITESININDSDINKYDSGLMLESELDLMQIITDSLAAIENLFKELKSGNNFEKLAESYNHKVFTIKTMNGIEYSPNNMGNDINRAASQMQVGEIYGPIKVPEGYSVFKLVDKKEINSASLDTSGGNNEEIKKNIFYQKFKSALSDYTIQLAKKYGIKINEGLVNKIYLNDWKVFTYRLMGFGGKITAMPLVFPFYEWYPKWEETQKGSPKL